MTEYRQNKRNYNSLIRKHAAQVYGFFFYLPLFFLFSFLGWLWEAGIYLVTDGEFVNRGILSGPWLPIYGCGGILLALLFRTMDAIRRYDSIMAMTAGGPGTATQTLNIYSYYQGFSYFNIGYSSALSLVMLVVIFAISMVLLKRIRQDD